MELTLPQLIKALTLIIIQSHHSFAKCHPHYKFSSSLGKSITKNKIHNHIFSTIPSIFNIRGGGGRVATSTASSLTKQEKIAILSGRPLPTLTPPSTKTPTLRRKKTTLPPSITPQHPLSQAGVPTDTWNESNGTEFQNDPTIIPSLTRTALDLCALVAPPHLKLQWKPANTLTSRTTTDVDEYLLSSALLESLPPDTILLWTANISDDLCYGSQLPLIKSRGLIHGLAPRDIASLLMDSSRVKTYNKMSLGRTDVVVWQTDMNGEEGLTKIVRNLTKPPLVKTLMEFRTMMHARRLRGDAKEGEGYIVVSRAVKGGEENSGGDNDGSKMARSEIMLGVNLLRAVEGRDDVTDVTSVTHVNSPFVNRLVAGKVGLKGAVDFFNDVRALGK